MAAVITIGSLALAADGKTITATLSGGTGTGYTISSFAGLGPKLRFNNTNYYFPIASQSITGTTLTVVLALTVGTGETPTFDLSTAATITDSGANTVTGQNDLAITNGSAVTVTQTLLTANPTNIETAWPIQSTGTALGPLYQSGSVLGDYAFEWVADCTEMAVISTIGTIHYRTDGGADSLLAGNYTASAFWAIQSMGAGLAAGKHLFQIDLGIFVGIRIAGGSRTMHAVPTKKATIISGSLPVNAPTTGVTLSGTYTSRATNWGQVTTGTYVGARIQTQFTGTGVEVNALCHVLSSWAAKVDGTWGPVVPTSDGVVNNIFGNVPVVTGLAPGTHTLVALHTEAGTGTTISNIRVINGTKLSAGTSIGATTITVPDVTYLAVGDWVKIDRLSKREWRQIQSITGSGPYTVTLAGSALAIAHSSDVPVTSYSAPAGSLATWTEKALTGKVVVGLGDSNTHGWNEYGFGFASPPDGVAYVQYDTRQSAIFQGADSLNHDFVNLGIQGRTSAQIVGMAQADVPAANTARGGGGFDFVTVWIGTNDINGTTTTVSAYQANIQSCVDAIVPTLKSTGKCILIPPATPSSTNAGGLNIATAAAACVAVASGNPSKVIVANNLFANLILADYNGLHFNASGRVKIGAALQPYLIGGDIVNSAGYFGTP